MFIHRDRVLKKPKTVFISSIYSVEGWRRGGYKNFLSSYAVISTVQIFNHYEIIEIKKLRQTNTKI